MCPVVFYFLDKCFGGFDGLAENLPSCSGNLYRLIGNNDVMAFILLSAISVLSMSSAFADCDGEHYGPGDHDGYRYQREYQQPYG